MYPGTGKPPVAPKPKLLISVLSPAPPRKEALLPPVSEKKLKPAIAPKPKSLIPLIAVESKPAISISLHNKCALATTKTVGLLNTQNGVKDRGQNPDWDNITPVCLYCDGSCSCAENANGVKTEEDHKVFQRNKAVPEGQGKLKNAISNNQTYATTHKTFNKRDASSPNGTEKVTNGRVLIQSLLDKRVVNGTAKAMNDPEPRSQPMSGTPTKPVPVPRKPRTAAPVHQEKAVGERQNTAVEKEREVDAKERKKSSDGKGGSSLSVSAPEPENKQQTQPAPPPRKKPFLSEPKKDPNSALRTKEAQEEDTSWDSSIYDMEVSVDKEDDRIYKEGASNQEVGGFLLGSFRCRPVRTPVTANEMFKETPKKPLRNQPPRKKSFREEHMDTPIGHQTRQVYTNQGNVFKNGGTKEPPPPNIKPPGNLKSSHLSLTKSKAKSFTAADMTRSEGQKRSSFRKLLDSKLTITILPRPKLTGGQGTTPTVNNSGPSYRQHHFDRRESFPQTGFEQNVDGDQSSESDEDGNYDTIDPYESYYQGNYMNVPLRREKFSSGSHSHSYYDNDDEEDIYEMQDPYSSLNAHAEDNRTDLEQAYPNEIFSDFELEANSSEEDDGDNSSTSSKGDPELAEAQSERTKNKIQYIAKEIMTSESVFVDVLKLLHVDFRESVNKASSYNGKPIIEERLLNQILYYLPQLYELNQDLLRELKQRVDNWDDNSQIADIFLKKGPYLKMYSTYIREFDKNVALLEEQSRKNPAFGTVVREFEKSPRCANLALKHYLLKPVQRIPQYQLLLTDYLKNLSEGADGYEETKAALSLVKEVANHANDIIKHGDNFQKLIDVQHRLNGNHQIIQPGRIFIKEGVLMKLSRKVMQPRMFFLFNDILLYTKPVQTGQYKLKNMLSLAGMKVSKPNQEAYQNELNIESVERSFILSGSSAAERDEWLDSISAAINEFTKKKISFLSGSSPNDADVRDGAPLGSKAPIWIPDPRTTMCMICTSEFTLTWRRHHCRACGKVVCQGCSSNRHYLQYLKKSDRVCDLCFQTLKRELDNTLSLSPGVKSSMTFQKKQKRKPAALKEVSANTDDSSMSGYLQRSKHKKKQWKRLWFVIKDKVLYTYAASEDVAAMESQPLLGFVLKYDSAQQLQFRLFHKNTLYYNFKADDVQTVQRWINSFKEATIL
ncbi:FYVE, RhoGEF and PH domain-containing protein 6 [Oryzias melastigma]|uniref:FYVE, RhoGEF and PH domain containing 6 n=1 Tax=Oryzias melastigma TaxID=30732 RepID=A0A3B3DGF4_ORYME|nr:FYVE, RhoGEF and PH domain-containing protein 6 [Oryzias melastigma]